MIINAHTDLRMFGLGELTVCLCMAEFNCAAVCLIFYSHLAN